MSSVPSIAHLSFEEWLDHEATGDVRHELVGGVVFAMTGGLRRHNLFTARLAHLLYEAAEAHRCRVYVNDMKVQTGPRDGYYPDVMVACDPPVDERYEVAPCLVVEVLSPSTAAIDRREKFAAYTRLPSLHAYVVADPDTQRIEVHRPGLRDRWRTEVLVHGDTLELTCPPVDLPLADLYRTVE